MAISTKTYIKVPKISMGKGVQEVLSRTPVWVKSDNFDFNDGTGSSNFIQLPGNALITEMRVLTRTAFDPSGVLAFTVPNDTGTEAILSFSGMPSATGWTCATLMALTPASGGMLIGAFTAPTTNAAGSLVVYLSYIERADQL